MYYFDWVACVSVSIFADLVIHRPRQPTSFFFHFVSFSSLFLFCSFLFLFLLFFSFIIYFFSYILCLFSRGRFWIREATSWHAPRFASHLSELVAIFLLEICNIILILSNVDDGKVMLDEPEAKSDLERVLQWLSSDLLIHRSSILLLLSSSISFYIGILFLVLSLIEYTTIYIYVDWLSRSEVSRASLYRIPHVDCSSCAI